MEVYNTDDRASSKSIERILNARLEQAYERMLTTDDPFKQRVACEDMRSAKFALLELVGDA